ncbi:MAG: Flp pilus assembly protein CpaB [Pseudomonadota bacterium]
MLKTRTIVMFLFALMMGLAAAFLAKGWADNRLVASDQEEGVQVVVAALQIPFGKKLERSDLRLAGMPKSMVPSSARNNIEDIEGTVAMGTIYPDEIILKEKVAKFGGGSALSAVISPKKRAVTVRVNDVIGVAGFLMPGNRVDVVSAAPQGSHRKYNSETLLENVKVLAVDQTASPEKDKPVIVRAVTLELSPNEAEKLVKATQEGTVQLSLRNPLDDSTKPQKMAKKAPQKKVKKRVVSRSMSVTVIRGTEVSTSRVKM